jgi:hypothetical protein
MRCQFYALYGTHYVTDFPRHSSGHFHHITRKNCVLTSILLPARALALRACALALRVRALALRVCARALAFRASVIRTTHQYVYIIAIFLFNVNMCQHMPPATNLV